MLMLPCYADFAAFSMLLLALSRRLLSMLIIRDTPRHAFLIHHHYLIIIDNTTPISPPLITVAHAPIFSISGTTRGAVCGVVAGNVNVGKRANNSRYHRSISDFLLPLTSQPRVRSGERNNGNISICCLRCHHDDVITAMIISPPCSWHGPLLTSLAAAAVSLDDFRCHSEYTRLMPRRCRCFSLPLLRRFAFGCQKASIDISARFAAFLLSSSTAFFLSMFFTYGFLLRCYMPPPRCRYDAATPLMPRLPYAYDATYVMPIRHCCHAAMPILRRHAATASPMPLAAALMPADAMPYVIDYRFRYMLLTLPLFDYVTISDFLQFLCRLLIIYWLRHLISPIFFATVIRLLRLIMIFFTRHYAAVSEESSLFFTIFFADFLFVFIPFFD